MAFSIARGLKPLIARAVPSKKNSSDCLSPPSDVKKSTLKAKLPLSIYGFGERFPHCEARPSRPSVRSTAVDEISSRVGLIAGLGTTGLTSGKEATKPIARTDASRTGDRDVKANR